ncbi:hypothetical protein B0H13DRAFT_1882028 [Mycena leptocephala]|nr:hypothetical protein B0H13DRAFT_1882028 [Mycena leptocephala]
MKTMERKLEPKLQKTIQFPGVRRSTKKGMNRLTGRWETQTTISHPRLHDAAALRPNARMSIKHIRAPKNKLQEKALTGQPDERATHYLTNPACGGTRAKHVSRKNEQQAHILIYSALIKWRTGEYTMGLRLANEAHKLAKLCGNYYALASALRAEGFCYQDLGNITHSLVLLKAARDLLGHCGISRSGLNCNIRSGEAEGYLQKSEYAKARKNHIEIIQIMSQEQEPGSHAFSLLTIAQIDVMIGANEQDVLQTLEKAKTIFISLGHFSGAMVYEMILADLNLRDCTVLAAKNLSQKCLDWSWTKDNGVASYCLERMADVSRWGATHFHWTSTNSMVYLEFAKKTQQKLALYKAFRFLGDVLLSSRDESTAENLFTVALEAFTYMDVHQSRADCMLRLGDIAQQRGDIGGAAVLWRKSRPLFERSQQTKNVGQVDDRLAACELDQ